MSVTLQTGPRLSFQYKKKKINTVNSDTYSESFVNNEFYPARNTTDYPQERTFLKQNNAGGVKYKSAKNSKG